MHLKSLTMHDKKCPEDPPQYRRPGESEAEFAARQAPPAPAAAPIPGGTEITAPQQLLDVAAATPEDDKKTAKK